MLEKCFDGIEVFSVQKNLILFVILGKKVNSTELFCRKTCQKIYMFLSIENSDVKSTFFLCRNHQSLNQKYEFLKNRKNITY